VRTVLAAAVRVVEASFGRLAQRDSHLQSPDRQITLHPVAYGPSNDPPRMQVEDDS
jgi:hypothetical protein